MLSDVTPIFHAAGITEQRATAAVALITDTPVDKIIGYVIVAIRETDRNPSQLIVVSSMGTNRRLCASVLHHAASHMTGRCRACRKLDRRSGNVSPG